MIEIMNLKCVLNSKRHKFSRNVKKYGEMVFLQAITFGKITKFKFYIML